MKYEKKLLLRLVSIVLFLALYPILEHILTFLTIHVSNLFLSLFYKTLIVGNSIFVNDKIVSFVPACIAMTAYSLLFLLITLTKDINLKASIKLFLIGAVLIFVLNIIRIEFLTFLLIRNNYNLFETVHMVFWNFVSGAYVAFVWIFLVKRYKIKSIPIYSDIKHLYNHSILR